MAIALALACGVVAMEFASHSGHRASYLRRRLDLLQSRIGLMQTHLLAANREIAALRDQAAARREFSRILAAPDGRVIHLEPVERHPGSAAVLVTSPRLAAAVLEATKLPALAPDQHYSLWWVQRHGPMLSAQPVIPPEKDNNGIAVQLSAPPLDTNAVVLMLERGADGKPARSPLLRGDLRELSKH
jgi:hypothetical protein